MYSIPVMPKQTYHRVVVHVPNVEMKRFKTIVRALGVEIEKKNALDEALEDIEAGRVYTVSSVDELRKRFA